MKSPRLAAVVVVCLFALANACSSTSRPFQDGGGSGGALAGSGGALAGSEPGTAGSKTTSNAGAGATPAAGGGPMNEGGTALNEGGNPTNEGGAPLNEGGAPTVIAECRAGEQEACWELEDGTAIESPKPAQATGSCHLGQRFCSDDRLWGPCLGAVGPKASDACNIAGNDDNCDGAPNGGCACVAGAKRSCGSDVGSCVKGEQTCVAQVWGPCQGEVAAKALDSCLTVGNDDNCNGKANDGCPCIGSAVEACGECGSRQCNAAARLWGNCLPAPSECTSPTQVRDCSALGQWTASTCPFACLDGQCTGSCVPGSKRCVTAPERRQECGAQGTYSTIESCAAGKLCEGAGAACTTPCAGQKLCPGNVCVPLGGCCSNADCANGFACTAAGTCSTTVCQPNLNGPCGGVCTTGCCSINNCPQHPNMGRTCTAAHQCTYACNQNFGNCDGSDANGCEVDLRNGTPNGNAVKDCGVCGTTCDFPNPVGNTDCHTLTNSCLLAECLATFKPIGDTTDEFAYDCPERRPRASLLRGDCGIGCSYTCDLNPAYVDCNGNPSDGCETLAAQTDGSCTAEPYFYGD